MCQTTAKLKISPGFQEQKEFRIKWSNIQGLSNNEGLRSKAKQDSPRDFREASDWKGPSENWRKQCNKPIPLDVYEPLVPT